MVCAFGVTGDLCDAFIAAVDIGTAVTGGDDMQDLIPADTGFFKSHFKGFIRTDRSTGAGRDDDGRGDLFISVHNNHIGTG